MENIIHWIVPDEIFYNHVRGEYKDHGIEKLRGYKDRGHLYSVNLSRGDIIDYFLTQCEKLNKMIDEDKFV